MNGYLIIFLLFFGICWNFSSATFRRDQIRQQKRDLTAILEKTAKRAESIGKAAIKFFLPANNKLSLDAIRPIGKRHVKRNYDQMRSVISNQLARSSSKEPNNKEGNTDEQTRTLKENKEILSNFENLVSKVNNAFVTYTGDKGVTLQENLSANQNGKTPKDENSSKRTNETPQEVKAKSLKDITSTFTNFICRGSC